MNNNEHHQPVTEDLKKCEERFLKAFLASPDGVSISKMSDGRIRNVNDTLCNLLGYAPDELLGRSSLEMGIWKNPEDRKKYVLYLGERGEVTDLESTLVCKDGKVIPVLISGQIMEFQNEHCIISFLRDIRDRKSSEAALRASEEHYRQTIDAMKDGVYVTDRDHRLVLFNRTSMEMSAALGLDTSNVVGKTLFEAFPFLPDFVRADLESVFRTGQMLTGEHTVTILGRESTSESRLLPLIEDGRVVRVVTIFRDITDRKRSERALQESEFKYRSLTNNIPDIIVSIGSTGAITALNDVSLSLTGYEAGEIITRPFLDFIHHDDREKVASNFHSEIKKKKEFTRGLQFRIIKKDGSLMWVELNSHRRFSDSGDFIQEDAVLRDITERKQAEEERAFLSKKVAERTAELSAANAELSRAVKAKDEFLASMSHELRTPLSSILSISESLDEEVYGPLSDRQRKAVKSMTESGQHLLSLINDILDLSKIEAGKITLDIAPVTVEDLCQASMRLARSQAFKKKLSVSLTIDSQVTMVNADERFLKQILVNLLGNAVKFTNEGGKMGLEVQSDMEAQVVRFTVWDSGIGIPPEKQSLLFKPFTQLDSSLSRQYGGTGLGLALVARLTEMHGGSVSLESSPGEGSRFTVSLPWTPSPADGREETREPDAREFGSLVTPSIRHALVIEDSQGDAEQIARYLREIGVNPIIQSDGAHVIEKVLELKPDLIFLDLMLPDMSGWDILKMLKADERTRSFPVIIASVIDERQTGRNLGAVEYIVKPFSREQLKKVLYSMLKGKESGARALVVAPEHSHDREGKSAEGKSIVLAEDNETTIETVSEYLAAHSYCVIVARNGQEACDRIRETHPALVLMDVQMPGMDGLEAIARIREDSDGIVRDVPIIALTALAMVGDRERCIKAGADDYLSKPVSLRNLVQTMETLIAKKASKCPVKGICAERQG